MELTTIEDYAMYGYWQTWFQHDTIALTRNNIWGPTSRNYIFFQLRLDQAYDDISAVMLFAPSGSASTVIANSHNLTVWLSQGSEVGGWEGPGVWGLEHPQQHPVTWTLASA